MTLGIELVIGQLGGDQTATIVVGIIAAVGAVLAASIPYYFTKRNEIALNVQKIQLQRYDDLLQAFVKWLQTQKRGPQDENEKKAAEEFIMAYQRASSYASPKVLKAIENLLKAYQERIQKTDPDIVNDEIIKRNAKVVERIDLVFMAVREDVTTQPKRQPHYKFKSIIYPQQLEDQANLPAPDFNGSFNVSS